MPIEPDDIVYNKAAIVERALRRAFEEYAADPELENHTHFDALILNLERACQAVIDMASHVVTLRHLGFPQSSADAFVLMEHAGLIDRELSKSMVAMTGFRNVAVHEYQELDRELVRAILSSEWRFLVAFCKSVGVRISPEL